ncbi:MAG: rRNA pseudouridine synthase [Bdellovibrionales bacterium]|nr:rRNA pseudouridine synthase [Bdellovibrionales bacterium]
MSEKTIRLNRFLSLQGVCSRRKADQMIAEGRISVNGSTIRELGHKIEVKSGLSIEVDGVPIDIVIGKRHYYAFYKPKNVITTLRDPENRPCVGDYLDQFDIRLFPIGRLDFDAEGLLIVTNDGDLSHKLAHPKFKVKKTYSAKVKGKFPFPLAKKIAEGLHLEDGWVKPIHVSVEKTLKENTWVKIVLTEGRNHIVKNIFQHVGHPVLKLIRTEFAGIKLDKLQAGQFRELSSKELSSIN